MADDFGNGVSRTLSALQRQFQQVVWQASKPPLDSELNLIGQIELEQLADAVRSQMHSGFLLDPLESDSDFVCGDDWCNWFKLGNPGSEADPVLWANVNGWLVPVTGSGVSDGDTSNRVNLWSPPSSDTRADLVFLEVWKAQVAPNPSTANKPSATTLYKYGNAEFGGTNLVDQMEDPTIGFETTERVQLQYRLRVVGKGSGLGDSVDFASFPDGLDDPNVLAQGGATAPVTGIAWTNMRDALGDPGLWRAGSGDPTNDLNTVDGYSYAIPVCAIFRRNSTAFVARTASGNANQNGAYNRNPVSASITDPAEATRTLSAVTITGVLAAGTVGAINVTGLSASGMDNALIDWSSTFIMIGDEIISLDSVDGSAGTITISDPASATAPRQGRGRYGTQDVDHAVGSALRFFCFRPDGLFADQVHLHDIQDLRRGVTAGEWDYEALLAHNLGKLFKGDLRTSYKQSAVSGGDVEGLVIPEVDTLWANGSFAVPNQSEALDGPDGLRVVWSDSAVVQNEAALILAPSTSGGASPTAVSDLTAGTNSWPYAADFAPAAMQPQGDGWRDQTVIELSIGGSDTNSGARKTVRTAADNRFVRFVSPQEYWLSREPLLTNTLGLEIAAQNEGSQTPFLLRFQGEAGLSPAGGSEAAADHAGPIYPLPEHNFELPYIVLGGVVNTHLFAVDATTVNTGGGGSGTMSLVRFTGVNFDTPGEWATAANIAGSWDSNLTGIANLCLHGTRNLYDMLTRNGTDKTGLSSELYLVLTNDTTNSDNCGVFRVVGAGTIGYTSNEATVNDALVVQRVGVGSAQLVDAVTLTAGARSQYTHTQDGDTSAATGGASAVVVLTDIEGTLSGIPSWQLTAPVTGQAILDTSVLYGPSRGGTARVGDSIDRIGLAQTTASLVRNAPAAVDANFAAQAGVPSGEYYFPPQFIQTWNRLPSKGLNAPYAPDYGDGRYMVDQRRESEVFVDEGSKTLQIKPFQHDAISLEGRQISAGTLIPLSYTDVADSNAGSVFETSLQYGFEFPPEFMPRFGRQDIPFHVVPAGAAPTTGPVYFGVNHLLGDSQTTTDTVFRVIGGSDNGGVASDPLSMFFVTGSTNTLDYGEYGTGTGLSTGGYKARLVEDVNVISSDIPKGLNGIQLPPFLGVARIYGVYDLREFSGSGVWNPDRVTPNPAAGLPSNLLRTDADKQTLYIMKGGASDVTGDEDDHTYIIPSDVIDITLSGSYSAGQTFSDIEFVVECEVFGFARGFINKNNLMLVRNHLPDGTSGIAAPVIANAVGAILPLPLPYNDQVYSVYSRTVYQGDPFMTRDGATRNTADYEFRYGQIPASSSFQVGTPIQQYDSTDDYSQVPEIPNARSLEILATADFWTTLGTGKVAGDIYAGTALDPASISPQGRGRIANSVSDPVWQCNVRTLSQGQGKKSAAGSLKIQVLQDSTTSAGEAISITQSGVRVRLVSDTDFSGATASLVAQDLANTINTATPATTFSTGTGATLAALCVKAEWDGEQGVTFYSTLRGSSATHATISLTQPTSGGYPIGFKYQDQMVFNGIGSAATARHLQGAGDTPINAILNERGTSPVKLTGMTERLPLGILVQDSDFVGEDPLRTGTSGLVVNLAGGSQSSSEATPLSFSEWDKTQECGRIQGGGQLGMADGSILRYDAWTLLSTTGTKTFRLFRGGGSAYVLEPSPQGGPVDFSLGEGWGEEQKPVLKGATLLGRAFLVRNYPEQAFASNSQRSYGDEVQMVIVTQALYGEGAYSDCSYTLDGQISPTGYGKGFAASDRYRVEGKLLVAGHSKAGENPVVELAPYPGEDPALPDDCP